MIVRQVRDPALLMPLLQKDRVAAAYFIGDLDERYWPFTRWWGAFDDTDTLVSLVLLYTGLRLPAVLTLGETEGVVAIFGNESVLSDLPRRFFAHLQTAHVATVSQYYDVGGHWSMTRMGLPREKFVSHLTEGPPIDRVTHADTGRLMELYRYYPDNFFEPYQLESGFYRCIRDHEKLVTVAGVHIFSRGHDIGVLGNVLTHPDYRGKGHSTRCTSAVLADVLKEISLVALNVRTTNVVAKRIYGRLGFYEHMTYVEGQASRR